ncbi:MAG: hypothetical protein HFG26_09065 [Provencibacterium sp.]|jgi:hypothetical protein|nr:hypothetical protein [Provencibacterium sp.]
MSIYSRIDSARKGITWKYINDHVDGAYHGRMTDLKNGKTTLSDSQLRSVAEILGTTTDYLLGNTDDPIPAGKKEKPPTDTDEELLGKELISRLVRLTPEELEKVDAFVQGLLASR